MGLTGSLLDVSDPSKKTPAAEAYAVLSAAFLILGLLYLVGGKEHGSWLDSHWVLGAGWVHRRPWGGQGVAIQTQRQAIIDPLRVQRSRSRSRLG